MSLHTNAALGVFRERTDEWSVAARSDRRHAEVPCPSVQGSTLAAAGHLFATDQVKTRTHPPRTLWASRRTMLGDERRSRLAERTRRLAAGACHGSHGSHGSTAARARGQYREGGRDVLHWRADLRTHRDALQLRVGERRWQCCRQQRRLTPALRGTRPCFPGRRTARTCCSMLASSRRSRCRLCADSRVRLHVAPRRRQFPRDGAQRTRCHRCYLR
jgi:hypothetical protein